MDQSLWGSGSVLQNFYLLSTLAFILVFVRAAPYATANAIDSIRSSYFSIEPRTYYDYFLLEQKLLGREQYADSITKAIKWIRDETKPNSNFLSFDLGSEEIGYFTAFAGRQFIQSLNLRHYRGPGMGGGLFATHYDLGSYQFLRDYLEHFLETPLEPISSMMHDKREYSTGSTKVDPIQNIVFNFTADELKGKKSIYGKRFNYVLSKTKLTQLSEPIYNSDGFFVYKLYGK